MKKLKNANVFEVFLTYEDDKKEVNVINEGLDFNLVYDNVSDLDALIKKLLVARHKINHKSIIKQILEAAQC
jgi:hypothetical protein